MSSLEASPRSSSSACNKWQISTLEPLGTAESIVLLSSKVSWQAEHDVDLLQLDPGLQLVKSGVELVETIDALLILFSHFLLGWTAR